MDFLMSLLVKTKLFINLQITSTKKPNKKCQSLGEALVAKVTNQIHTASE